MASVDRVLDLLERHPAVVDAPDAVPAPPLAGRLGLRRVTFGYEHEGGLATRPVLRDLSFEVSPGEVVALVGRSGAGESTIAQLIPRLFDRTAVRSSSRASMCGASPSSPCGRR